MAVNHILPLEYSSMLHDYSEDQLINKHEAKLNSE